MRVDRSRFLLLTAALAAASAVGVMATGCTVTSTDKGTTTPTPTPTPDVDSSTPDSGTDTDAYVATDGGDGGACLGDTGGAASCSGVSTSCAATCAPYLANYKVGVARDIISCLDTLPTCEGTDAEAKIANCVKLALAKTCDDSTATDFCAPMAESCGTASGTAAAELEACVGVAKGLNATGRAVFTQCVTEGTAGYCGANPSVCVGSVY